MYVFHLQLCVCSLPSIVGQNVKRTSENLNITHGLPSNTCNYQENWNGSFVPLVVFDPSPCPLPHFHLGLCGPKRKFTSFYRFHVWIDEIFTPTYTYTHKQRCLLSGKCQWGSATDFPNSKIYSVVQHLSRFFSLANQFNMAAATRNENHKNEILIITTPRFCFIQRQDTLPRYVVSFTDL